MKLRNGAIVGLLCLATCGQDLRDLDSSNAGPIPRALLGTVPPTEVAVWQKVASINLPDARYLQAAAFDETRRVVVMFGGMATNADTQRTSPNGETWEWNPTTGKWTNRTGSGAAPDARSGASMVFDAARGKLVLFGGRAGSGYDFGDTWEWDPTTGVWTNVTAAGSQPSARSQHGMVYEKGMGKILLFGGGHSDTSISDGTGISVSLGDTWEYDPATYAWKPLTVTAAPSARHAFGMVWDSVRGKAVIFGGMDTDTAGAAGTPKQDTWEWDGTASAWTERTAVGTKPIQRYAQAMAFDGSRGKVLLFGGFDMRTGGSLNDLWELDPATFAWKVRLAEGQSIAPLGLMYASLLSDDLAGRLALVAGVKVDAPVSTGAGSGSSGIGLGSRAYSTRNVWELEPVTLAFTDRSPTSDIPDHISHPALAYNPTTGRTYLYGGSIHDSSYPDGYPLDELCEWDGQAWSCPAAEASGWSHADSAMAYDPARNSLIVFGGIDNIVGERGNDTWEFSADGTWTQLNPAKSPGARSRHRMVTDTTRGKILLFGGTGSGYDDILADLWEWDGAVMTWTNRTPPVSSSAPTARDFPLLTYDEGRQKMFLFDGLAHGSSATVYWEWDPITAGWASYSTGDAASRVGEDCAAAAYDPIRRRQVIVANCGTSPSTIVETWEIDTKTQTLYVRSTAASPLPGAYASMVFDSARGVMVLYAGDLNGQPAINETWEYMVTNLANGEGCTAAFVSSCASGFCVDGVCCDVAACAGACQSCSVASLEGTCGLAAPGTEVPGSCAAGMACDATGACKNQNGQACAAATECASGFCADGVCCDSACAGACASCNQAGRAGRCTPYAAGSDPEKECGQGTGACKSSCDGVSACALPTGAVTCAYGGSGGSSGGSGGNIANVGGSGGNIANVGGTGGSLPALGGSGGSPVDAAGDAGTRNTHKPVCDCALGRGGPSGSGLIVPLLLAGAGFYFLRKRGRARVASRQRQLAGNL